MSFTCSPPSRTQLETGLPYTQSIQPILTFSLLPATDFTPSDRTVDAAPGGMTLKDIRNRNTC